MMILVNRLVNFFTARPYSQYLLLFFLATGLFSYLHADKTFADPDSFYHARSALVLAEQGAITQFPWLSATSLKYNFVDHHLLYHLALIPFVKLLPPLEGLKLATVLFAAAAMLVIFWFLRQLKVKGAFWYVLFLLTINPFIFRLTLAKAQQLVLIFLILFIYLLFSRRYLLLVLISALYVWLYAGWPLAMLLTSVYVIINSFWWLNESAWWKIRKKKFKIYQQNLLFLFSVSLGLVAGIFFSPYFPGNLTFYWQQSFKIAIVNYQYIIGVGAEWYPYKIQSLLLAATPFFALLLLAFVLFVISLKTQTKNSWLFFSLTILFFLLTLKSRRYVEYFIPLAVCFSAISLNQWVEPVRLKLKRFASPASTLLVIPLVFLVLSPIFYRDLQLIKSFYQDAFSFDKYSRAALWLKHNSESGDIVFHSDWDEFPILFYYNTHNYYLVGLDPTFMFEHDRDLHKRWVEITRGEKIENLHPVIKNIFNAKYVFVDINQNPAFNNNLAGNFFFEKVFEDSDAAVYKVLE